MLACYMAYWDAMECEVIAVEHAFRIPLMHPGTGEVSSRWELAGKIDVLISQNGRVKVLEHKTTGESITPGGNYHQKTRIDGQITQYLLAVKHMGHSEAELIYDVLVKPRQKPLLATPPHKRVRVQKGPRKGLLRAGQRETDETPSEYEFRLREVMSKNPAKYLSQMVAVRTEKAFRSYQFDLWHITMTMEFMEQSKIAPRNPGACRAHHTPCPYFDVCDDQASIYDNTKFRNALGEHEELDFGSEEEPEDEAGEVAE